MLPIRLTMLMPESNTHVAFLNYLQPSLEQFRVPNVGKATLEVIGQYFSDNNKYREVLQFQDNHAVLSSIWNLIRDV